MLSEFLKRHPIRRFTRKNLNCFYPPAEDRAAWDSLSSDVRQQAEALIAQYAAFPYPMRTASGFMAFVRTGSRQIQRGSGRRRDCVSVCVCFPGWSGMVHGACCRDCRTRSFRRRLLCGRKHSGSLVLPSGLCL